MVIPEIKLQVQGYQCQGVAENCNIIPIIYREHAEGAAKFNMPYAYFISSSFGRYYNNNQQYLNNLDDVVLSTRVQEDIRVGRAIVVVDDSTEMFNEEIVPTLERFQQRYDFLNNTNFVYSTSNKGMTDLPYCDVYGDHFILEYCRFAMLDKDLNEYQQILQNRKAPFRYKFCCLQGEPRPHRVKVYRHLRSMYDANQAICTINKGLRTSADVKIEPELGPYDTSHDHSFIWHLIQPEYYTECASAFVTETYVDDNKLSMSEKIVKNLIYPQPFVAYTPPGIIQELRTLGYNVYDEYVDHAYDMETNKEQRLQLALSSFMKLIEQDSFPKDRAIAEYNRQVTRNLTISQKFINYLKSKLNRSY